MPVTMVYLGGNPAIATEIDTDEVQCYACKNIEAYQWCEWCGQWECAAHVCDDEGLP